MKICKGRPVRCRRPRLSLPGGWWLLVCLLVVVGVGVVGEEEVEVEDPVMVATRKIVEQGGGSLNLAREFVGLRLLSGDGLCPAGKYNAANSSNTSAVQDCTDCPEGTFKAGEGDDEADCQICPTAHHTSSDDFTSCVTDAPSSAPSSAPTVAATFSTCGEACASAEADSVSSLLPRSCPESQEILVTCLDECDALSEELAEALVAQCLENACSSASDCDVGEDFAAAVTAAVLEAVLEIEGVDYDTFVDDSDAIAAFQDGIAAVFFNSGEDNIEASDITITRVCDIATESCTTFSRRALLQSDGITVEFDVAVPAETLETFETTEDAFEFLDELVVILEDAVDGANAGELVEEITAVADAVGIATFDAMIIDSLTVTESLSVEVTKPDGRQKVKKQAIFAICISIGVVGLFSGWWIYRYNQEKERKYRDDDQEGAGSVPQEVEMSERQLSYEYNLKSGNQNQAI